MRVLATPPPSLCDVSGGGGLSRRAAGHSALPPLRCVGNDGRLPEGPQLPLPLCGRPVQDPCGPRPGHLPEPAAEEL